jgi:hypothetical protein
MVLMPYDLFSWKKNSGQNQGTCNYIYKNLTFDWVVAHSLCADPPPSHTIGLFFFVLPHVVSALLGIKCLSFPLSGGLGLPLPPPPILTPFLSGPRQQPVSMSSTILVMLSLFFKYCDFTVGHS